MESSCNFQIVTSIFRDFFEVSINDIKSQLSSNAKKNEVSSYAKETSVTTESTEYCQLSNTPIPRRKI